MATQIAPTPIVKGQAAVKIYTQANQKEQKHLRKVLLAFYLHKNSLLTTLIAYSTMYYIGRSDHMAFSIRLNEEERLLAESYARLHAISVGEAFKKALFDKIDEEFDVSIADAAYKEYVDSGRVSRPFSELKKELNL